MQTNPSIGTAMPMMVLPNSAPPPVMSPPASIAVKPISTGGHSGTALPTPWDIMKAPTKADSESVVQANINVADADVKE